MEKWLQKNYKMNLRKLIIIGLYFPFYLFNIFLGLLGINKDCVRIILMHDIPLHRHKEFKSIITSISRRWTFISVNEFEDHFSGKKKLSGRNVLLTFDDGFHSNRVVADEILDPLGIKALFFIVGRFAEKRSQEDQQNFIINNLYPEWRGHDYPSNLKEMKNMDINDLKHLSGNGHSIGFHSTTHKNLATLESESDLKNEIVDGALILERKLGIKINHFSFGFGNIDFFSKKALEVANRHFSFIHTGMRGRNVTDTPLWALRRDTISLDDSNLQIASFLEGSADTRYTKDFKRYESWLEDFH